MKIDEFLKTLSNIVLCIGIGLMLVAIGYTIGESEGRKYSRQFYYPNGTKIFYSEPVRAMEFKISKKERGLEIYAPNFIIDSERRDTVFASKFILTTEITNTP